MIDPSHMDVARSLHRATADVLDADDFDAGELLDLRSAGLEAMRASRWRELIPPVFQDAQLAAVQADARTLIEGWLRPGTPGALLLFGAVGVGKTYAAVAALRELHLRGFGVRLLTVPELLDRLRPSAPDPLDFYALADFDALALDDVGSEQATGWTAERLSTLINRRWMEQRRTIITTNLTPVELHAHLGMRTYSRLADQGTAVALSGADRRLPRGR